jgi:hypothetical protein
LPGGHDWKSPANTAVPRAYRLGTALALVLSVLEPSLPIHQERNMNTRISSKLAAFAIALMMNSLLIGGVGYLFGSQVSQAATVVAHVAWA